MVKCGEAVILHTYPAWSFGGKHKGDRAPAGPGTGKYGLNDLGNNIGPRFGPPSQIYGAPPGQPPPNPGTRHLKTGYLSQEPKAPGWSFGMRHPLRPSSVPGPGDYDVFPGIPQTLRNAPTSRWGPPPRQIRAVSAPRVVPVLDRPPKDTRIGPSFKGLHHKLKPEDTPGPAAYAPRCHCKACDGYHGVTMGSRTPMFYGQQQRFGKTLKAANTGPGPNHYHVDCSTIGAATMHCEG